MICQGGPALPARRVLSGQRPVQFLRTPLRSIRPPLARVVFYRPERAILATLFAGVLFGHLVRALLPLPGGPAPASASARPAATAPARPPHDPAKDHAPHHSPDPL